MAAIVKGAYIVETNNSAAITNADEVLCALGIGLVLLPAFSLIFRPVRHIARYAEADEPGSVVSDGFRIGL